MFDLFDLDFEWKESNKILWTKIQRFLLQNKVNLYLINKFLYLRCGILNVIIENKMNETFEILLFKYL